MEHIVCFSGGKDSTAMLLRMIELNYHIDKIVFADTQHEFPEMYDYINKIEKLINRPIIRTKPKKSFDEWFFSVPVKGKYKEQNKIRGFPFSGGGCYWCRESKVRPMFKICKGNIVYIGIAKDEPKRLERKEYKPNSIGTIYKFPLNEWGWTEQDCVDYLNEKGLLNPLYYKFKRLGCWFCPKMNLESLKSVYLNYPELWERLKEYEKHSPHPFRRDFKDLSFREKQFKVKK
jgi:3'-phosphoadenosine 5'-phosphosulfate sulfotransferase (PAPS reductase)/FAD synthetase